MAKDPKEREEDEDDKDLKDAEDDGGEVVTLKDGKDGKKAVEADAKDDAEGDDERVAVTDEEGGDEDREKLREARRKERKQRKVHQRRVAAEKDAEIIALRRQVDELSTTVSTKLTSVDQRLHSQDTALVERRLGEFKTAAAAAEAAHSEAISKGDGAAASKAMKAYSEATNAVNALEAYKANLAQGGGQQPQQRQAAPAQQAPDPVVSRHASEFQADYPWFKMDPNTSDEDSLVVFAIDSAVRAEGYQPNTRKYWDELRDRVERRLPHRMSDDEGDEQEEEEEAPRRRANGGNGSRRGPALGAARGDGRNLGKDQVYVPKALKDAMQENGSWNDPKKRASIIKRYQVAEKARNSR